MINQKLETSIKKDLDRYLLTKVIKTLIPINDEIVSLLMHSNINDKFTQELDSELEINLKNNYYFNKI